LQDLGLRYVYIYVACIGQFWGNPYVRPEWLVVVCSHTDVL